MHDQLLLGQGAVHGTDSMHIAKGAADGGAMFRVVGVSYSVIGGSLQFGHPISCNMV